MLNVPICILFVYFLLFLQHSLEFVPQNSQLYQISKRNLLTKELKYLKTKPLSEDMQKFIKRFKRKAKSSSHTEKRNDEIDKDHMYVVENGEIIPFKQLDYKARQEQQQDLKSDTGNFTVIPLIIPITMETMGTDTQRHVPRDVSLPSDIPVLSELSSSNLVSESQISITNMFSITTTTCDPESTRIIRKEESSELISTSTSTLSTADDETDSTERRPDAKVLNKVIDDVQELIKAEQDDKSNAPESAMCNVTGDWDSDAGGMQIRIEKENGTCDHPFVHLVEREPPPAVEGFLNQYWIISAYLPFNHSSVVILTAVNKKLKKAATFIGECRVCEGDETISGSWMIGRKSKGCEDREESHMIMSDLLKKNNVRALQAAHLREITSEKANTT